MSQEEAFMKNHVLRPLWVAMAFVALILLARYILVPKDFGVQGEEFHLQLSPGQQCGGMAGLSGQVSGPGGLRGMSC